VLDFSRAFLNGERGRCAVMMLKTFMDETGIHDDAEIVAVGCYIAKPKTWRDWTRAWNQAKKPINVFHATDCANLRGEFDGWTKEQRDALVAKLMPIIADHGMAGMVIGVQLNDLNEGMKDHPELMEMFGTPYTACFQWVITSIIHLATQHGSGQRMVFVHEVNDYKGDAMKAFDYVHKELNPRNIRMGLGFGAKTEYPPLQAADVLAYEGGKFLKNPTGKPRRAWTALDPNKTRIIAHRYAKDKLIRLLTDFRAKLLEQGWDGKVVA
jgi:hypothetical protein